MASNGRWIASMLGILFIGGGALFLRSGRNPEPVAPPDVRSDAIARVPDEPAPDPGPEPAPAEPDAPPAEPEPAPAEPDTEPVFESSTTVEIAPGAAGGGPRAPTPIRLPDNAPPVVTTTSLDPEYGAIERRLARFITALQQDRREAAADLLSSRVPAEDREALIRGHWLTPTGEGESEFEQLLFLRDVQIRPRGLIQGDSMRLSIEPRFIQIGQADQRTGYLEIRMRREHGNWYVDLRRERRS